MSLICLILPYSVLYKLQLEGMYITKTQTLKRVHYDLREQLYSMFVTALLMEINVAKCYVCSFFRVKCIIVVVVWAVSNKQIVTTTISIPTLNSASLLGYQTPLPLSNLITIR